MKATAWSRQGVAESRARVGEHAFGDVYATAGPGLRQAVTEDKFLEFMDALDRKLGPWESASEPAWNVTRTTNGHFVRLTYESRFARGIAAEQFVWQIQNGRASFTGYYVNSPLLVTN
jgi:hypothetical protein